MSLADGKRSLLNKTFHAIHQIRRECERNFDRVLSQRDAALIKGLCLGSSHEMSSEDRKNFLNAGLIQNWMYGALDLDSNPRIDKVTGKVDMGCYERPVTGTAVLIR